MPAGLRKQLYLDTDAGPRDVRRLVERCDLLPGAPGRDPVAPGPSKETTSPLPKPYPFAKGHGAENDFVILTDPDGQLTLTAQTVVDLCRRRTGIGADGLLRAVRCLSVPGAVAMADQAEWFMDYRNADGTVDAMCGNGIRVMARHLVQTGLAAPGTLPIATRAGMHTLHVPADPDQPIRVHMGRPRLTSTPGMHVHAAGHSWPAFHVDVGTPHAVVFVDDLGHPGPLDTPPRVEPDRAHPAGVTVDFVTRLGPRHLALRVHERGVGETRACGTGACAAVATALAATAPSCPSTFLVDFPGGRLRVTTLADGTLHLTGPAVIVARGQLLLPPSDTADQTQGASRNSEPRQPAVTPYAPQAVANRRQL